MDKTIEEIKSELNTLKALINKFPNLSLSETLELYKLRSYYFKMYGLTKDDILYTDIDELIERVKNIKEKIKENEKIKNITKVSLDDIFSDDESSFNDFRQVMRKSFFQKILKIKKGGRDLKLSISENEITINIPKSVEIKEIDNKEKIIKTNEIEPNDIFDSLDTSSNNKKEEIVYVDDIPILKFTGVRYRVFKYNISEFDKATLKKIANKLKEIFNDKFVVYFMRIFNINSRKDVKKIIEED